MGNRRVWRHAQSFKNFRSSRRPLRRRRLRFVRDLSPRQSICQYQISLNLFYYLFNNNYVLYAKTIVSVQILSYTPRALNMIL